MTRTATIERWPMVAAAALACACRGIRAGGRSGILARVRRERRAPARSRGRRSPCTRIPLATRGSLRCSGSPAGLQPAVRPRAPAEDASSHRGADVVPGQRARASQRRTGWVPAGAVELRPVRKRLFVDRSERRYEFWNGDTLVRAGKVAVGAPGAETPTGLFYVQSKFTPTAPILGAYAFETSAYSKLSDWPGGGVVGVQGRRGPGSSARRSRTAACGWRTPTSAGSARACRRARRSRSSRRASTRAFGGARVAEHVDCRTPSGTPPETSARRLTSSHLRRSSARAGGVRRHPGANFRSSLYLPPMHCADRRRS